VKWAIRFRRGRKKGALLPSLRSMHAGFVRYGSYVTRTLARGSDVGEYISWNSRFSALSLSLSLSHPPSPPFSSHYISFSLHLSLSISLCICLSFPLTPHSVNIHIRTYCSVYGEEDTGENSVSPCVSTIRRMHVRANVLPWKPYRENYTSTGIGEGEGRGDEEDTLTVHNNATKERIHWNTLGETEDRNAETRRKQRDALTPVFHGRGIYRIPPRRVPVLGCLKNKDARQIAGRCSQERREASARD